MNNNESTDGLKQFLKLLGEVAGFAITILGYIFAILGRPLPPFQAYPATTSILTILLSLIFLWLWRWSKITSRKPSKPGTRLANRKKPPVEPSSSASFFALWSAAQDQELNMPRKQRRFEISFLLSLTLAAFGITGLRLSPAMVEISEFHCINELPGAPKIVIANFVPSNSDPFGDNVANVMDGQARKRLLVCRYKREIKLNDEAEKIGAKYQATLVIWGNINNDLSKVYLTTIGWERQNQHEDAVPLKDGQDDLALLSESILAELLLSQGNVIDAQNNLSTALDSAETQGLDNSTLMADSYFLLALLYDPNQIGKDNPQANRHQAIRFYSRAIELNTDFDSAYLNRAYAYDAEGEIEKAIADLSNVINRQGTSASAINLLTRGQFYIRSRKYSEAISDFETALNNPQTVTDDPTYFDLIHYLGMAYLLRGDITTAEQTYQRLPALSKGDTQYEYMIKELSELPIGPNSPETKEAIERIINSIKQLQTP
jgi:tetratricopeptide (TPR) repeat protein